MVSKQVVILGMVIILTGVFATTTMWSGQNQISLLPPSEGMGGSTIVLDTAFPEVGDSYPAYKTITPDVTFDYVKDIGKRFGLTGEPELYSESTGEIKLVDDTKEVREQVSVYKHSGAIVYEIPDKQLPLSVESQHILPSEEDAKRIASEYLLERDLLPEGATVKCVRVDQKYEIYQAGINHPIESYNVTLAVMYSRSIDGIPVYGDEMAVIIGTNNEIVGVIKSWRDVVPSGYMKIKTPEQAYEELIAGKGMQPSMEMKIDKVIINDISIGYWIEPRIFEQESVLPAYVFSGIAIGNGKEVPFRDYVSAV